MSFHPSLEPAPTVQFDCIDSVKTLIGATPDTAMRILQAALAALCYRAKSRKELEEHIKEVKSHVASMEAFAAAGFRGTELSRKDEEAEVPCCPQGEYAPWYSSGFHHGGMDVLIVEIISSDREG
jgi:hypothetical protein